MFFCRNVLGSGCRIATTVPLCDEAVGVTHFNFNGSGFCFEIFLVDWWISMNVFFSIAMFVYFGCGSFRNVAGERRIQRVPLCDELFWFFCLVSLEISPISRFKLLFFGMEGSGFNETVHD